MFKTISDKVSLPDLEKEILAYWKTHRIFEKSVEGRQNAPDYTFYEGPPTANGKPGIHHVFARTIKDLVCRLLLEKKKIWKPFAHGTDLMYLHESAKPYDKSYLSMSCI